MSAPDPSNNKPGLTLFVPTSVPPFSLKRAAEWLLQLFEEHKDLDPGSCCRFRQLCRAVLKDKDDVIPSTSPQFPLVLQADKDLRELHFLWHVLRPSRDDQDLWRKVRMAIRKGRPCLAANSTKCAGRDTQFELVARSILTRSGMQPIGTAKHADFRCRLGQAEFAVECKRVTSMDAIVDEAGHAASQIGRLDLPGMIFMDYSDAVSPADHIRVVPPGPDQSGRVRRDRAERFWRDYGRHVRRAVSGKRVVVITFFDHLVLHNGLVPGRPHVGQWEYCTIRDSFTLSVPRNSDRQLGASANELIQTLGLPGPIELDTDPEPSDRHPLIVRKRDIEAFGRFLRGEQNSANAKH